MTFLLFIRDIFPPTNLDSSFRELDFLDESSLKFNKKYLALYIY